MRIVSIVEEVISHGNFKSDKVAVISNDKQVTYGELSELIQQAASYLNIKGIKVGDKVVLEAFPSVEFISYYFATHLLNAVAVPLDVNLSEEQYDEIRKEVEASFIITFNKEILNGTRIQLADFSHLESLSNSQIVLESEADIIFTSGTTGKPKGVVLSHLNMLRGAENIIEGSEMAEDTVNLLGVPIHHAFGLGTLRALMLNGATVVLINGFSSLKSIKNTYDLYKCNAVSIVPSALNIINELCKGRLDYLFSNLKYFEFGSASITEKLLIQLREQFPTSAIYASYGSTESPRTMYVNLAQYPTKINTIGKPVSNVQVSILDDDYNPINSSSVNVGRVCFSGEMNSLRYWKNNEETRKSFNRDMYYSNDLGYIDGDGFVTLVGRMNDMLNIGGKKIPASQIEKIVCNVEGVKECACVGVFEENSILGEIPIAFVVLEKNAMVSEQEILTAFKVTNNHYIKPKKVQFIDKLPLNRIGKVDKKLLKELLIYEI